MWQGSAAALQGAPEISDCRSERECGLVHEAVRGAEAAD